MITADEWGATLWELLLPAVRKLGFRPGPVMGEEDARSALYIKLADLPTRYPAASLVELRRLAWAAVRNYITDLWRRAAREVAYGHRLVHNGLAAGDVETAVAAREHLARLRHALADPDGMILDGLLSGRTRGEIAAELGESYARVNRRIVGIRAAATRAGII